MLSFEEFEKLSTTYNVIPLIQTLAADTLTPVLTYLTLREAGVPSFILESVEPNEKIGRFSFIGSEPRVLLEARGARVSIREGKEVRHTSDTLFAVVRRLLSEFRCAPLREPHGLMGGFVGYVGYNAVRVLEHIPIPDPGNDEEPDALLGLFGTVIQFDHRRQIMTLVHNVFLDPSLSLHDQYADGCAMVERVAERLGRAAVVTTSFSCADQGVEEPTRDGFMASVMEAKHFIKAGDIFQVVLSRRMRRTFGGDLFAVYRALRMINPSPYLFYLDFGQTKLAGSSPEVLVRLRDNVVNVLPIAGTRPRGSTDAEDKDFERELLADAKELAEHVMLVDLGRNDIGRIAEYGSVSVPVFKRVDRFSHVMHIVSEVQGRLRDGMDAVAVLEACFPAGTVSGAPKVRAMEIIQSLEPFSRGAYAGAVGYIGLDGVLDTCIAIRTVFAQGNILKIQAGAGIVADSDPGREYDETVSKARAVQEAVRLASTGLSSPFSPWTEERKGA